MSVDKDRRKLRVVIDTNIIISYLWGSRNAERIMGFLFSGAITPVVSDEILNELLSVGRRGKFRERFSQEILQNLGNAYRDVSEVVRPKRKIVISPDRKDIFFLECAVEADADYIISGDRHLLEIEDFEGVRIVAPAGFIKLIQ